MRLFDRCPGAGGKNAKIPSVCAKGTYYYRNLQQTQAAYAALTDVAVEADFDEGCCSIQTAG